MQNNFLSTCYFNQTGSFFNTGRAYAGGQRCSENFSCSNPSEIVHFKFNQFDINTNYDYFAIGLSAEYEGQSSKNLKILPNNTQNLLENGLAYANSLVLEGSQQTGVWVSAKSIQDFRIYFYRKVQFKVG